MYSTRLLFSLLSTLKLVFHRLLATYPKSTYFSRHFQAILCQIHPFLFHLNRCLSPQWNFRFFFFFLLLLLHRIHWIFVVVVVVGCTTQNTWFIGYYFCFTISARSDSNGRCASDVVWLTVTFVDATTDAECDEFEFVADASSNWSTAIGWRSIGVVSVGFDVNADSVGVIGVCLVRDYIGTVGQPFPKWKQKYFRVTEANIWREKWDGRGEVEKREEIGRIKFD